ncbi:exopolysaccharide biosynthesis protein [Chitinimonas arctica]|uniref:Exopolysaccharide biosynthesis protein n=1 Tax=Chitinimonas arctica TaxID=2594795 RepID=A0A516SEP9_9NEIS|nr:sugar transferase [Chitinimonas arctica]QDQ26613.1 exopolysaccharide biosynthesis protein [Chitinimonas arctica]
MRSAAASSGPKRLIDIVVASVMLLALAPLMLLLIVLLRAQGGPALFAHVRVGQQGRAFRCFKFRSMHPDAERRLADLLARDADAKREWERDFKLKRDPRVTVLGEFLRKSSLDELPQLWNVLRGEMSLVGPRPIVAEELARYGAFDADYIAVRPGITGLWQVSGRNDTTYDERVRLDSHYVRNWSLALDCRILFRTLHVVIARQGAY